MRLPAMFCLLLLSLPPLCQLEQLTKSVENLKVTARVSNGIFLGSVLSSARSDQKDFVAELLGVPDIGRLDQVSFQMDYGNLKALAKMSSEFSGEKLINATKSIELVTNLYKTREIQEKVAINKTEFLKTVQEVALKGLQAELKNGVFDKFLDDLGSVLDSQDITAEQSTIIQMDQSIPDVEIALDTLEKHAAELDELLLYDTESFHTLDVNAALGKSEEYSKNFRKIQDLPSELVELKKHVKNWIPLIEEQQSISGTIGDLSAVENTVELMTKPMGRKELTVGLPNGIDDLELMFNDMKGEWVKKVLAGGKEPKELEKILEPLKTFTSGMRRLEGLWTKVKDRKSIDMLRSLRNSLNASNLPLPKNPADIESSIDTVRGCFSVLKNVGNSINFDQFREDIKFMADFNAKVSTLKESRKMFLQAMPYLNEDNKAKLKSLGADLTDIKIDGGVKVRNTSVHLKTVQTHVKLLSELASFTKTTPSLNTLDLQKTILDGTDIGNATDCFNQKKFTPDGILSVLNFLLMLKDVNTKINEVIAVEKYLGSVKDLSDELGKVIRGADKKPKIRRRRQVGIVDDWEKTARDLGKGVQVLVDMENVWKNQKKVEHVAKCGQAVDKVISGLPGMSNVWTDKNKKGLMRLVGEVNALDGKCANISTTDLTALSQVFQHATLITGVPINAHLLDNPVSVSLATSQDPAIQKFSTDFKDLSDLNLDFAKATDLLNAAEATLQPITDFFNSIFGIKPSPRSLSRTTVPTESSPFPFIYLLTLLPVALVVVFIFWFLCKPRDPLFFKKFYMKDKDLDKLILLHSRHLAFQEKGMMSGKFESLTDAVHAGDADAVKSFLAQGAYVDRIVAGEPLLHHCLKKLSFEMIELLIRHGANQDILNSDRFDWEAYLEYLMMNQDDVKKLKVLRTKILELQKHKFQRTLPPPMSPSKFKILLSTERLKAKAPKCLEFYLTDDVSLATHVIVETDKESCYCPDESQISQVLLVFGKSLIMKSSWLEACQQHMKNIKADYLHRVEKVRFNGVVYNSVVQWNMENHTPKMPFLQGVNYKLTAWPKKLYGPEEVDNKRDDSIRKLLARLGAVDSSEPLREAPFYISSLEGVLQVYSWFMYPAEDEINLLKMKKRHVDVDTLIGELLARKFE